MAAVYSLAAGVVRCGAGAAVVVSRSWMALSATISFVVSVKLKMSRFSLAYGPTVLLSDPVPDATTHPPVCQHRE